MAVRPVFVVTLDNRYCVPENVTFEFFSGFSEKQKRKCIDSLHKEYLKKNDKKILEISTKSNELLGVQLSAFNLMIKMSSGKKYSIESVFQSSKVFEHGGPYKELKYVSPGKAKRDERLRSSGKLIGFNVNGVDYNIEPKTFFYNWLYINTLRQNRELSEKVLEYDAFTDIEFNPKKSINCQAEAAAIYVSLFRQGLLEKALQNKNEFLKTVYCAYEGGGEQLRFVP